jgi:hypothetical protein
MTTDAICLPKLLNLFKCIQISIKEIIITASRACYNYLCNTGLVSAIDEYQKRSLQSISHDA